MTTPTNIPSCIHVARGIDPQLGGTSVAIPALARYTAETGRIRNSLALFRCSDDMGDIREIGMPQGDVFEIPWESHSPRQVIKAYTALRRVITNHDVAQIHGLWQSHTSMAVHISRSVRKPYIVSAHGMLDPWALRNKSWKKILYSSLIERRNLRRATCLRALTRAEAENYRAFGVAVPVAVIPNGITAPESFSSTKFLAKWPHLRGKRIVLFLSRIHYKKGLDILCSAWRSLARSSDDLHLVLAGPDSEHTQAALEGFIREERLSNSVTFTGMLDADMKWSALSAATLFVLPSYSEGFSIAILEAMSASRPVVITRQCNFPDLEDREFAVLIEPEIDQLRDAIESLLRLPAPVIAAYGRSARNYVRSRYAWPSIGSSMAGVYEWMLGGDLPSSVELIMPSLTQVFA